MLGSGQFWRFDGALGLSFGAPRREGAADFGASLRFDVFGLWELADRLVREG